MTKLKACTLAVLAGMTLSAQDFIFNNGSEPQSLDPAMTSGVPESRLSYALFEGLMVNDAKTALPVPGLASSYKVSKDLKTYTFTLRKTTFSDGTPITAQSVVDSWMRVLDPKTASPYAYLLGDNIVGADAYTKGKGPASDVKMRAVDAQNFEVTFVGPLPYALAMLTHNAFDVTPTFAIQKFGAGEWTKPGKFIGSGPYILKEWKPQDKIVVVKNPKYWDAKNIKMNSITYLAIEDMNVVYDKFKAGEIDYMPEIPAAKIDEIKLNKNYHHVAGSTVYYFIFNVTQKPFDDVRVRKALSMALNRQELVDKVLKAGDVPSAGLIPPMGTFKTTTGNGFNLDGAKKLLAQAGFPDGKGFPKFPLIYNTSQRHKTICEWLQQSWKKNLGIDVELQNLEWNTFLETRQKTHDFKVARAGWQADYPDPSNYLDMFKTAAGNNDGLYSNKKYDDLEAKASMMPAGPARDKVMMAAENILVTQDQAIIPVFFYVNSSLFNDAKWGGLFPNSIDIHQPRWWFKK